jgi:peptidoglycan/LPS O-acetylase OafA/YrhL
MRAGKERSGYEDLKPLTSLRFVAGLLVFFDHAPLTRPFADRYGFGQAGVGFFFLLSGFILTWRYRRVFAERVTWHAVQSFYVARFARIYPMLLTATALAAIVLTFGEGLAYAGSPLWSGTTAVHRWLVIATELTATKAWLPIPAIAFGVNPPSWSIADEAFFYALFPIIAFSMLRALRGFSAATPVALAGIIWIFSTASFLARPVSPWFMSYFPPSRLIDFAIGMLAAVAVVQGLRLRHPTVVECVSIALPCAIIAASPAIPESLRFALALMPGWALLVVAFSAQRGRISHILSHPAAVYLGEISFAFYLVHHTAIEAVTVRLGSTPGAVFVALALSLSISSVLFACVEGPCRQAILRPRAQRNRNEGVPLVASRVPPGVGLEQTTR